MKKLIFLCLFLSAGLTYMSAQTEGENESLEGAKMTFESLIVEYGEIAQGSDPLRIAEFTNTGTEPLVISSAKGSCGCTVPEWPKEPIMPGETAEMKIRYDTKRPGPINKTVKINSNDPSGVVVLQIKGKVNVEQVEDGLPKKTSVFGESKPN